MPMFQLFPYRSLWFSFTLVSSLAWTSATSAQVIPDSTLGTESSTVRQDTIKDIPSDLIEGGATRGTNLFHSLQQLSIQEGRGAYFANPAAIQNILTRITGSDPSKIFGTLGVLGNANLFLINPNGIVFGPNARLDIRGAFVGSTADSMVFENGFEFSATNPDTPPLLTVNIPLGLRFRQQPSDISNEGNLATPGNLTLKAGNLNLSGSLVAGGDLTLEALNTVTVRDTVFSPFIAVSGGKLTLQGNQGVDVYALNHPQSGFFSAGDMVLRSANTVGADAHFWSGGSFRIERLDGSLGGLVSLYDPIIRANGDVFLESYTGASLHVLAGGSVTISGFVWIQGTDPVNGIVENVTLSDGTIVSIDDRSEPTLDIRAGTTAFGEPFFNTGTPTSADIVLGSIKIYDAVNGTGGKVFLTNQYQPNLALSSPNGITVGAIDNRDVFGGGSVIIDARGGINLIGILDASSFNLSPSSNVPPTYLGNAGNVTLLSQANILSNSSILAQGLLGGNVSLISTGDVFLDNGLEINVRGGGGGNITINATNISLLNASKLRAGIATGMRTPDARAGDITINANETVIIADSSLISNALLPASIGNAGDIKIATSSLLLNNGGQISARILGKGDTGAIKITANDTILLTGVNPQGLISGIYNRVESEAEGSSGGIEIATGSLYLNDGAQVNASTSGRGDAGAVKITSDIISAVGGESRSIPSGIYSQVDKMAEGISGSIEIVTSYLSLNNGAQVNASTFGRGDAGSVKITSDIISLVGENSRGFPSAIGSTVESTAKGNSGDIVISTGFLSLTDGASINASTYNIGNAGVVKITSNTISAIGESRLGSPSGIFSSVADTAKGNSGGIEILTGSLTLTDGASINASTFGKGDAGAVKIASNTISAVAESRLGIPSGIYSTVAKTGKGNSGGIEILTGSLSLTDGAVVNTSTFGKGDAGAVKIISNTISAVGENSQSFPSGIGSIVTKTAKGNSGGIEIITDSVFLNEGGVVNASTFGKGNAGLIKIIAIDNVFAGGKNSLGIGSGIYSVVTDTAEGNSEGIEITTSSLSLNDGAKLSSGTLGKGNAGDLLIKDANLITATGGSQIRTDTFGQGNAGSVTIDAPNATIIFDEVAVINNKPNTSGIATIVHTVEGLTEARQGGDIYITAQSLSLTNGAQVNALTAGRGNAGNVTVNIRDMIVLDGSFSGILTQVDLGAIGNSGDITLTAGSISLSNGAQIASDTFGIGDAGKINLTVRGAITLKDFVAIPTDFGILPVQSSIATGVQGSVNPGEQGAIGNAGTITIKAQSLSLDNLSLITTATLGTGNAADISIQVDDFLTLTRLSTIESIVGAGAIGNSGNIDIKARSLTLTDGSQIETQLSRADRGLVGGQGEAGDIQINASDFIDISGVSRVQLPLTIPTEGFSSGLFASTEKGANGSGGTITVTTNTFRVADGAVVNALTAANSGNAGDITINANTFEATGGGQVLTTTRSSGNAGSITLNIKDNIILYGSNPTFADRLARFGEDIVNNQGAESGLFANTAAGSTGKGGSIFIDPITVTLTDNARISVNSQGQGDGGNISLTTQNLTLDNRSEISATTASGEGGNLTLKVADTLRQRNNSSISTTAGGTGNGGNITLNTKFLINTVNSNITANAFQGTGGNVNITTTGIFLDTNSLITASSQFGVDGVVETNTLVNDPSQGLVTFPVQIIDPNALIAQNACRKSGQSEFIISGRGGLPSSPEQVQSSDEVAVSLVRMAKPSANSVNSSSKTPVNEEIVPARGWVSNGKGQVVLVAENPNNSPHQRQINSKETCSAP